MIPESFLLKAQTAAAPTDANVIYGWGLANFGTLDANISNYNWRKDSTLGSGWQDIGVGPGISTNGNTIFGIKNGELYAWGNYGAAASNAPRLGLSIDYNSRTTVISSPTLVQSGSWTKVFPSENIIWARRNDGGLFGWGLNRFGGIVGDATIVGPGILDNNSWSAVAASQTHMLAIRSTGQLFSWGLNTYGQLGLNNTTPTVSPVQVGTSSWTAVACLNGSSFAIRSDGALFAWGRNTGVALGALGLDDATTDYSSPVQIGTSSWSVIAAAQASNSGAFAITADRRLFAWGDNTNGALGTGNTLQRSSPVLVSGGGSWTAVGRTSQNTSVGLKTDGSIYSWGSGTAPNGRNSTTAVSSPVQIGTSSWTAISAMQGHVQAIRSDGALFAWGLGTSSQGGWGDTTARSSPVVIGGTNSWAILPGPTVPAFRGAAILANGRAYAWGLSQALNGNGMGLRTADVANTSTLILGEAWTDLSTVSWSAIGGAGGTAGLHTAIDTTGKLYIWGAAWQFEPSQTLSSPVQLGSSSWTTVSSSTYHTLAIRNDGALFAWGLNNLGALGTNSTISYRSPVQIGTSSWIAVAAGGDTSTNPGSLYSLAIRSDGALFAWGNAANGKLGTNVSTGNFSSPVLVGTSSWTAVAVNYATSHALRIDGSLFGWGLGGTVGDNTNTARSSPVQIGTSSWTLVASGVFAYLARRSDGQLFGWHGTASATSVGEVGSAAGLGVSGLTPDGNARSSPVLVNSTSFSAISTGYANNLSLAINNGEIYKAGQATVTQPIYQVNPNFITVGKDWFDVSVGMFPCVFAIDQSKKLYAWGYGADGQMGQGDTVSQSSPVLIGTSSWTAVSAGGFDAFAIRSDGRLFAWGSGAAGRLGLGDTTNRSSPTQVGTSSWIAVSAGSSHSMAIRSDGGLFTWGLGTSGRLGDIGSGSRSSPVQIGTSSWSAVAAGFAHSLAIRSDGGLFAFGDNSIYGALGDNTLTNRSSPVQIGTSSWTAVAAGLNFSLAIRSDGALFAWGWNNYGNLGTNSLTWSSSPVLVGASSWVAISAMQEYQASAGITYDGRLFAWGRGANSFSLSPGNSFDQTYSSPVLVASGTWRKVSINGSNTSATGMAIKA